MFGLKMAIYASNTSLSFHQVIIYQIYYTLTYRYLFKYITLFTRLIIPDQKQTLNLTFKNNHKKCNNSFL